MPGTLLIQADAGPQSGLGHVMRCLALAQGWLDRGGRVAFSAPASVAERLRAEGCEVHRPDSPGGADSGEIAALAERTGASWVVVDGYGFDSGHQRRLAESGLRLLWIDDYGHAAPYSADLVLNQNLDVDEGLYAERSDATRLLLGPRFALLRREFLSRRGRRREPTAEATRLLVTFGGADPDDWSTTALQAMRRLGRRDLECRLLVGPANPRDEALRRAAAGSSVEILGPADDMPALLEWADLALAAAGSTLWELLFMGLPSLLVVTRENQRRNAEGLAARGAALMADPASGPGGLAESLGRLLDSAAERRALVERSRDLVDGQGVARVLMRLEDRPVRLRRARSADRELLWEWANDPEVRRQSFSTAEIPWETHVEWMQGKLEDPACLLLVAEDEDDRPVGQARFDLDRNGSAEISVSLARAARGRGLGAALISEAVGELARWAGPRAVDAYIRPDNAASVRAFERARFRRVGRRTVRGVEAIHLRASAAAEGGDAGH